MDRLPLRLSVHFLNELLPVFQFLLPPGSSVMNRKLKDAPLPCENFKAITPRTAGRGNRRVMLLSPRLRLRIRDNAVIVPGAA